MTKYEEAANRELTQQNVSLFIHFSVSRMRALCYIFGGKELVEGARGTHVVKNILCKC